MSMYGGAEVEGLNSLRYRRFCDKVSKGTAAEEPQSLPPTFASSMYHSLRVYYQVMEWKDACINMRPEDYGWNIVDGRYLPIQTDQPAAPSELLDVIYCSCKKDCTTRRCTCRKYSLPCTNVCRECRGGSCTNSQLPDLSNAYDDDG